MIFEIITASFVTHTALLTANVETRYYRSSEPHIGILFMLFVFLTLFPVGYLVIDMINPIAGFSGLREFGLDEYRLSEVMGNRERIFITGVLTCFFRFRDLFNNKWKLLFLKEEWLNVVVYFGLLYVFVEIGWCVLWVVDVFWV